MIQSKSEMPNVCRGDLNGGVDYATFNFLENLLVFCPLPVRSVPTESHVAFEVYPPLNKKCLILIFKTDLRQRNPLVRGKGKRPDYLCVYIDDQVSICTIIEMKTANPNEAAEQIEAFYDLLSKNIQECAPTKCRKLKMQGIVVGAHLTQTNTKYYQQLKGKGLPINLVNKFSRPELFEYISKYNIELGTNKLPTSRTINPRRGFSSLELALLNGSCKKLSNDACFSRHRLPNSKRLGLYLDFIFSGKGRIVLLANNNEAKIFRIGNHELPETIIQELKDLGLAQYLNIQKFES
jgi:hypothetical protein